MSNCKKCEEKIPSNVKINGVWKPMSSRKYCLKCSPFNLHNTRRLDQCPGEGLKKCTKCEEEKPIALFYRGGKHSYCIPCSKKDSIERQSALKKFAVEYKGGKCKKCGYSKCMDALEFHHRDRSTKCFSISTKLNGISIEKLKIELDKCDLLCCRCHRELESIKNKQYAIAT